MPSPRPFCFTTSEARKVMSKILAVYTLKLKYIYIYIHKMTIVSDSVHLHNIPNIFLLLQQLLTSLKINAKMMRGDRKDKLHVTLIWRLFSECYNKRRVFKVFYKRTDYKYRFLWIYPFILQECLAYALLFASERHQTGLLRGEGHFRCNSIERIFDTRL